MKLRVIEEKRTLFLFKNQIILPSQRNSQAISTASQNMASASQQENQNVLDVVTADVIAPTTQGAKKRGSQLRILNLQLHSLHHQMQTLKMFQHHQQHHALV